MLHFDLKRSVDDRGEEIIKKKTRNPERVLARERPEEKERQELLGSLPILHNTPPGPSLSVY
jgi:hypothetical protein